MDRGLYLEDVAAQIGVTEQMISLWETHRSAASVSKMPAIIRFLGFTPYEPPRSFGEWLKLVRFSLGYSRRRLASLIGGDQRSVIEWESGMRVPTKRSVEKLRTVLIRADSTPQPLFKIT
jgi:transcriptional regulator with XRE-family HTH domain